MPRDVLELTADGRHELTARERGLSLPQRWLLVRVNGIDSLRELAQVSNQADALQRLPLDAERLVQKGLVRWLVDPQDGAAVSAPTALEAAPREVPAPRRGKARAFPAVALLVAAALVGVAAVGLALRGGFGAAAPAPVQPTTASGGAAPPAATSPAGPAGPAAGEPATPTRDAAARPALAPPPTPVLSVPAAVPAVGLVPAPAPALAALATPAPPAAVLAPITSALPASLPLPTPSEPAPVAPLPLLAAPVSAPGPMQPVFSPTPRLPREWQQDTRSVVRFTANLTIDAGGAVSQLTFSGATVADSALVRASRQSLLQWQFAPGAPGRTHSVELVFRAE